MPSEYQDLLEKNRRYLWNPFTQMSQYLDSEPLIIKRGEGSRLIDVNGKSYLDGNSSLWLNVHGHGRQELNDAITAQLQNIAHSTLLGMGNIPAINLAERLVAVTPEGLDKVFYSDSGATAVEIGLKMAFSYWRRTGRPEKRRFVSFKNAYHGDTIGAMSVGGIELFHAEYGPLLMDVDWVSYPYPYRFDGTAEECVAACLSELAGLLETKAHEVACLVVEPMIQGAGGMIVMPPGFMAGVRRLCTKHDILLLADEVATGFGRTGPMFACEHEGIAPDLLALGKGLTGGYLPLAATLASDRVYEAFLGNWSDFKAFFHGHSFTGNQLGCAAALASLDLFETDDLIARIAASSGLLTPRLAAVAELTHVGEIRQLGMMVGIELVEDRASKAYLDEKLGIGLHVCLKARELGLITRPLGDVITLLPPLATPAEDLEEMVAILQQAISEVTERL